jgi:hypothetical protein
MSLARRRNLSEAILPAAAFLITTVTFAPFSRLLIDEHHDGLLLKAAMDVLAGQILFKDTFSNHGPLTTYLGVGFLKLFGTHLYSLRLGTLLCYGLTSAFLVLSWREMLPLGLTLVAYLLWLLTAYFYDPSDKAYVFYPWTSVHAMTFQAIALYLLLRSLRSPRPRTLSALCGASAGLVYWCRFTVGTTLISALVLSYLAVSAVRRERPWKYLLPFIAANATIHGIFIAHIYANSSYGDWVYQNYQWTAMAFTGGSLTQTIKRLVSCLFLLQELPTVTLRAHYLAAALLVSLTAIVMARQPGGLGAFVGLAAKVGRRAPAALWTSAIVGSFVLAFHTTLSRQVSWAFAIPIFILAATVATLVRWMLAPGDPRANSLLPGFLCGLVSLASWSQYYAVCCPAHTYWALSPAFGAFLFYLLGVARGQSLPVALGVLLAAAPLAVRDVGMAREKLGMQFVEVDHPVLRGMLVPERDGSTWFAVVAALEEYTRAHPDASIVIYGEKAIYGVLVPDLRNATPFFWYYQHLRVPPDTFQKRLEFIARRKPLILFEEPAFPEPEDFEFEAPDNPRLYANQMREVLAKLPYKKMVEFEWKDYRPSRCVIYMPDW